MRPTHGGWHDSCYACTRASTKRQQAGPAGKTSRQDQQARPAGRTSRQDQQAGPAGKTSRQDQQARPAGRQDQQGGPAGRTSRQAGPAGKKRKPKQKHNWLWILQLQVAFPRGGGPLNRNGNPLRGSFRMGPRARVPFFSRDTLFVPVGPIYYTPAYLLCILFLVRRVPHCFLFWCFSNSRYTCYVSCINMYWTRVHTMWYDENYTRRLGHGQRFCISWGCAQSMDYYFRA